MWSNRRSHKVLFCLLLLPLAAPALHRDREQAMQIRADRFESSTKAETTILSGNVRIAQGSLVVQADRAEITQVGGEVTRAVLTGRPARLRQALEAGGEIQATAAKIDYALAEERVELSGEVVLERPQGTLRSERVVYSVRTGQLSAGESVQGGVELVIPPRARKADDQPAD
jgi:lipopolysaccharide export system protein LptA